MTVKTESFSAHWQIVPKFTYLFMSFAVYCLYSYREKFLKFKLGLDSWQGIISSFISVSFFVGGLFWANVSDKTGQYKMPLIVCSFASTLSFFGLYWFDESTPGVLFAAFLFFSGFAFFQSSFQPLCDALILRMIPDRKTYGRQRLFSTVGYGMITVLFTNLCVNYGWGLIFPAMCFLNGLFMIFIFFFLEDPEPLPSPAKTDEEQTANGSPTQQTQAAGNPFITLLKNPNFSFVIFIVFCIGLVRGIYTVFLSAYQTNVLNVPLTYSTASSVSGILLEIVIFFYSARIINYLGVYWSLLISLLLGLVRTILYLALSVLSRENGTFNGFAVVGIELLKGVIFGLTHTAAITIVMEEAPPHLRASAQAIYAGFYGHISSAVGSLIGQFVQNICKKRVQEPTRAVLYTGNITLGLTAIFSILAMIMVSWRMFKKPANAASSPTADANPARTGQDSAAQTLPNAPFASPIKSNEFLHDEKESISSDAEDDDDTAVNGNCAPKPVEFLSLATLSRK